MPFCLLPHRVLDRVGMAIAPSRHVLSLLAAMESVPSRSPGENLASSPSLEAGAVPSTIRRGNSLSLQQASASAGDSSPSTSMEARPPLSPQPQVLTSRTGFGSAIPLDGLLPPTSQQSVRNSRDLVVMSTHIDSDSDSQLRMSDIHLSSLLSAKSARAGSGERNHSRSQIDLAGSSGIVEAGTIAAAVPPSEPTSSRKRHLSDSIKLVASTGSGNDIVAQASRRSSSIDIAPPSSREPRPSQRPLHITGASLAAGSGSPSSEHSSKVAALTGNNPPPQSPSSSRFHSGPSSLAHLADMDRSYSIKRSGTSGRNSSAPIDGNLPSMVRPGSFLDVASEGGVGSVGTDDDDVNAAPYSDSEGFNDDHEEWSNEDGEENADINNGRWHEVQALPLHDPVTGKEVSF